MALVFDYSSFEDWIGEPQELTSGTIPDNECRENAGRPGSYQDIGRDAKWLPLLYIYDENGAVIHFYFTFQLAGGQ